MKKFKFTLGRMLDYKDQILTEEKNKLAVVRKRQSDLEQRIDSLENESCRISEEMNRGQKKGIAVFQLVAFQAQRDNIRQQVGQLRQDLKLVLLEVQKQTSAVVLATQEVSKLEKLQEKQLEAYRKGVAKAEELFIEEFVSAKMIRESEEYLEGA